MATRRSALPLYRRSQFRAPISDVLCTLNRDFFSPDVGDYCRERGVLITSDVDQRFLLRNREG
jgi:hypothetical protein